VKLKTHSSAKKRFRVTGSGKIKRKPQGRRHLLVNKAAKRKRHLSKTAYVSSANMYQTKRLLEL
jgi:large subunit ribosomal protein L35